MPPTSLLIVSRLGRSKDYDEKVEEVKFTDFSTNYKNSLRAERWKKTPEFLNKPHLSGSLLTSSLAGKKAG